MGTNIEPPPIDADRTTSDPYGWLEERLFPAIIGCTTLVFGSRQVVDKAHVAFDLAVPAGLPWGNP